LHDLCAPGQVHRVAQSKKALRARARAFSTEHPEFKGVISDMGGPSANMYKMQGKDLSDLRALQRAFVHLP
jgi:hypothetical protein